MFSEAQICRAARFPAALLMNASKSTGLTGRPSWLMAQTRKLRSNNSTRKSSQATGSSVEKWLVREFRLESIANSIVYLGSIHRLSILVFSTSLGSVRRPIQGNISPSSALGYALFGKDRHFFVESRTAHSSVQRSKKGSKRTIDGWYARQGRVS